ncbi:MFS transporter [Kribbella sandramycini]|nr:MFS transporter [Kribbella sandramycini]MBB6565965.1 MFS family permease [Kribbella sandramycini]
MDLTGYRELWRTPGVIAMLVAALTARLPVTTTIVPLAFLAKDASGNFGWAGVVAGAYAIGTAVASPLWSRMVDRRDGRWVVIATGTAWSGLMAGVALLPDAWFRLLPVAAALTGLFVAPVTSAARSTWPRLVQGARLRTLYALDATATELLFVIGPMLGAIVVSVVSPRAGLLGCAVGAAVTIWWFGLKQQPRAANPQATVEPRPTVRALLWHRHRLPMLIAFACMLMGFASMSIGIVAFADHHGNRLIAGVLEMLCALGSLIGGLVSGALPGGKDSYLWRRMLVYTVLITGCVFATSSVVALAAMMFAAGLLIAPTTGALYERLGVLTPESARTEIFGWMFSGGMIGNAIGSAVAGAVVEIFGVRYAWALMAALALVGTLAVLRVPPHRAVESTVASAPVAA